MLSKCLWQEEAMKVSVLVSGAGPVGLTMAAELARYGVSVRIVEKAAERTDKSKALVLWSRTLELMDRMGGAAPFVAAGLKATAANITSGKEKIARIELGGVPSPYLFALMLPQSETERLLEEYLNRLGVTVERSVELCGFSASSDGIVATLRHADGREETVESSWLIGCDGAHSTVRHQLGMEFIGDTLPSNWILGDLQLTGVPSPGEIDIIWHSDGILALFPITQTRYRVIADVTPTPNGAPRPDPKLEDIQAVLDARGPGGIRGADPIWLAAFNINERKVASYRKARVFLVGDAAHIHSPAGGQGMNTGMQDACNLAWKLALVCRGICQPEPLLASYSQERSAVGEEVLRNANRMTEAALIRGEFKQALRNHVVALILGLSPVRAMAARELSEESIGYPDSPLNGPGAHLLGGPAPGERAPIRQGETPVGSGDTPRFALFANLEQEASARLLARYPNLLDPEIRAPFRDGGIWLVRPDGYVALAIRHANLDELDMYLNRIASPSR